MNLTLLLTTPNLGPHSGLPFSSRLYAKKHDPGSLFFQGARPARGQHPRPPKMEIAVLSGELEGLPGTSRIPGTQKR